MFADDTKIFRSISSKEDAKNLQQDLNTLEQWSSKWGLKFNSEKCHILTLGKFENIRYTNRYIICDSELEHVYTEKDLAKYSNMVENVQIRATKLADNIVNLDYEERLTQLSLTSLKYRRKKGDMIEIFKHFNTYDENALSTTFKPRKRTSRAHKLQMIEKIPKDGYRGIQSNSFYYRTPRIWNSLPRHVAESKTINSFKNNIDNHWKELLYV